MHGAALPAIKQRVEKLAGACQITQQLTFVRWENPYVGKWAKGRYETDGVGTSWVKVKNPAYSQIAGRRELFETRQDRRQRPRAGWRTPVLRLAPLGGQNSHRPNPFTAVALLATIALALLSAYGWWFYVAVGPAHGPGAELGVVAAVLAIGSGLLTLRLGRRANRR